MQRMNRTIAPQLRELRERRGLSQSRLAALVGVSRQSYAAVEAGNSVPSTDIALRLARALGTTVERLFRLPEDELPRVEAAWTGESKGLSKRVRLARIGGSLRAYSSEVSAHHRLLPADGIREAVAHDRAMVALFADRPREVDLVAGGCDPALALVSERLGSERRVEVLCLGMGSGRSLEALARGEVHVAGVHLLDPETRAYNAPWIERIVPFPCTRIAFAVWDQGLVLAAGNPFGVHGIEDLAKGGLRFANREAGSGSRALLEMRLCDGGIPLDAISGFTRTAVHGHLAVAEAVASGLADAGVAIRAAAEAFGLRFMLLAEEQYELVIPNHFLDLPAVQALVDVLRRSSLQRQVEALSGYNTSRMGQPV